MKKKLLKFNSFVNEDLASKQRYDMSMGEDDESGFSNDYSTKKDEDRDKIEVIQSKLEDYEPDFIYGDTELDSQLENAGIIKSTVWIDYLDVTNPDQYDYDKLEEDFLSETDFDEVEITTTDNSIAYSINVYDYDSDR